MQEGAHQNDAAPLYLERSLHYQKEGKFDQWEGGGVGFCELDIFFIFFKFANIKKFCKF